MKCSGIEWLPLGSGSTGRTARLRATGGLLGIRRGCRFRGNLNPIGKKSHLVSSKELPVNSLLARRPPRVLQWKATYVERRIMKAATIRWDFPQGHADERSAQCWDRIPGP